MAYLQLAHNFKNSMGFAHMRRNCSILVNGVESTKYEPCRSDSMLVRLGVRIDVLYSCPRLTTAVTRRFQPWLLQPERFSDGIRQG
jgi:hypothetical protein